MSLADDLLGKTDQEAKLLLARAIDRLQSDLDDELARRQQENEQMRALIEARASALADRISAAMPPTQAVGKSL